MIHVQSEVSVGRDSRCVIMTGHNRFVRECVIPFGKRFSLVFEIYFECKRNLYGEGL